MSTSDEAARRRIVNRLKRARGQLDAVINGMETDAHCRDVVTQLSAVTQALNKAGFVIIATAMEECASDPDNPETKDGLTREELQKLFLSLA